MIKKTFLKTVALCVAMAVILILVSLSTKPTFRTASADGVGNVFGYAWSDNIGWIKMNSCADQDFNGVEDNCVLVGGQNWGVTINNGGTMGGQGTLSGYAWSDNIGWINFGGLTGPNGSGPVATMTLSGNTGTFSGWAKAINGGAANSGYEGWVSLAGANYLSPTTGGTGGVTYNKSAGKIVGYAWGGDVIGWIQFGGASTFANVTYGVPQVTPFDFTISVAPSTYTTTSNTLFSYSPVITVNLSGDTFQNVNLSKVVTTTGANQNGFSANLGSIVCPASDPDGVCNITLTISGTATTTPGNYTVTVTGTPTGGITKNTSVTVNVASNFAGTCTTSSTAPYYVGNPITRNFNITSGSIPYSSVLLTGTNIAVGGQVPTTSTTPNSTGAASYTFVKTYSTTGIKTGTVTVTDNTGNTNPNGCPPVTVFVNPNTNEF